MTELIINLLSEIVGSAERLGSLPVAAVWAFFSLILLGLLFYDKWLNRKSLEIALEARLEAAKADVLMAAAVEKTYDKVEKLSVEVMELSYKIEGVRECLSGSKRNLL